MGQKLSYRRDSARRPVMVDASFKFDDTHGHFNTIHKRQGQINRMAKPKTELGWAGFWATLL